MTSGTHTLQTHRTRTKLTDKSDGHHAVSNADKTTTSSQVLPVLNCMEWFSNWYTTAIPPQGGSGGFFNVKKEDDKLAVSR